MRFIWFSPLLTISMCVSSTTAQWQTASSRQPTRISREAGCAAGHERLTPPNATSPAASRSLVGCPQRGQSGPDVQGSQLRQAMLDGPSDVVSVHIFSLEKAREA